MIPKNKKEYERLKKLITIRIKKGLDVFNETHDLFVYEYRKSLPTTLWNININYEDWIKPY